MFMSVLVTQEETRGEKERYLYQRYRVKSSWLLNKLQLLERSDSGPLWTFCCLGWCTVYVYQYRSVCMKLCAGGIEQIVVTADYTVQWRLSFNLEHVRYQRH